VESDSVHAKVVFHEAWSTWTCDTTDAHVGERSLFFLGPGVIDRGPDVDAIEKAMSELGGTPILRNVGSGDGIVSITVPETGEPFVRFYGAPEDYRLLDPDGTRRGPWQLSKIVEHVETLAKFSPDRIVVRAGSRSAGERNGFDFRVLPDGSMCFAVSARSPLTVSTLTGSEWNALRGSLTVALGPERIEIGREETYNPYRNLRIAIPGAQLSFTDDDSVIVSGMTDPEFAHYRSAIDAWKLVVAAMNCVDCVDHSASDAELLKR